MSGAISLTTIAALAGAGAAVGGTAYSIYAGQKQQGQQKKALALQNQTQQEAEAASLDTERKSELAANEANKKTPNVASILAKAAAMGNQGLSSTMLTGPGGVSPSSLNLGKTSLLGT